MSRISVLLTTEGTYPFHKGGVSTWCHVLTQQLPEVDFKLFAVVANPYLQQHYDLSPNIREVIKVPLWGTEDPAEFSWRFPFSKALRSKLNTTKSVIKWHFLPLFEQFLQMIVFGDSDMVKLGQLLLELHKYFLDFDYHKIMTSRAVWSVFKQVALEQWQSQVSQLQVTVKELAEIMRLLYRLLISIHVPVPETDLSHSSAAAFCGLPCIIAKLQRGTPYLLTEHGINIREQYLNLNRSIESDFVRIFLYRLMRAVVRLNFHFANQISPVCEFNARWERWWGVPQEKIKVIYNGADPEKFHPTPAVQRDHPVVMNMGLIFPLKGQLDLIEAAAIVRDKIPNIEFRFYGQPSDQAYFAKCEECVQRHQLEKNINFTGFTIAILNDS